MKPTQLDRLMAQLTHPNVRDLAWTLLSPPLLRSPAQRHPLAASRWLRHPGELDAWFGELDACPYPLTAWLQQAPTHRLGRYYERLWQFALAQAPDVTLLASNLPVRRDGLTLGELDLLFEDAEGPQHVELAVKFYLGPIPGGSGMHWIGPGTEDRLDIKRERLQGAQLAAATTPEARRLFTELGLGIPSSRFWLGGYFFHAPGTGCLPRDAHPSHLRGQWLRPEQWRGCLQTANADRRWQPLPRPAWLAPARQTDAWTGTALEEWLQGLEAAFAPRLLVLLQRTAADTWREERRAFWVGPTWPYAGAG